jgi:hypothetical protein
MKVLASHAAFHPSGKLVKRASPTQQKQLSFRHGSASRIVKKLNRGNGLLLGCIVENKDLAGTKVGYFSING